MGLINKLTACDYKKHVSEAAADKHISKKEVLELWDEYEKLGLMSGKLFADHWLKKNGYAGIANSNQGTRDEAWDMFVDPTKSSKIRVSCEQAAPKKAEQPRPTKA